MMQFLKINNVLPQMKTGTGFFSSFTSPIWAEVFPDTSSLDIYFAGTYGQKFISPYMSLFVDEETGEISNSDLVELADSIYQIHHKEWEMLFNDLMVEYDPIENTDATETLTETRTMSGSNGNTRTLNTLNTSQGSTESTTEGASSGETSSTGSNTSGTDNTVYGFNSVSAVGQSGSDTTGSNTDSGTNSQETTSSTEVSNNTTSADTGTITDAGTNSGSESLTRTFRKHGNIGVMTNVQLLRDDTDYWHYWNFIRAISEDILSHIALSVY